MSDFNLLLNLIGIPRVVQQESKIFEYYSVLAPEVRMMIVNSMPAKDRCRFSTCSKLSFKEVDNSKHFYRELKLNIAENDIFLHLKYGPENENRYGFRFRYIEEQGNKLVKSENLEDRQLGVTQLDKMMNLSYYAILHCKHVLQFYQKRIKRLEIAILDARIRTNNINFGVGNLKNLEELVLHNVSNVQNFVSKTRKNLSDFEVYGKMDVNLTLCQEVYRVQRELYLPYARFTYPQFLQLSAQCIYTTIGEMTEDDIFNLIRSWQNDTFFKNFRSYCWLLEGYNFNVSRFFQLLGVEYVDGEAKEVEIKHEKDAGKVGVLRFHLAAFTSRYRSLSFYNTSHRGL